MRNRYLFMSAWILWHIGNLFFSLNGRLDGLERDNRRRKIMYWAWGNAWYMFEDASGRIPKQGMERVK